MKQYKTNEELLNYLETKGVTINKRKLALKLEFNFSLHVYLMNVKTFVVAIQKKCGIIFVEREIFHKMKTIVYNSSGHKKRDTSDFWMLGVSQSNLCVLKGTNLRCIRRLSFVIL